MLKFPFPDGVSRLTLAKIMPKHVYSQPGAWDDAIKGKAIGSGPYRQTAHHPKSNTTFEAYADYNGPRKAAFKKMNWLTIVDAAPRVAKISGVECRRADRRQHPVRQYRAAGERAACTSRAARG